MQKQSKNWPGVQYPFKGMFYLFKMIFRSSNVHDEFYWLKCISDRALYILAQRKRDTHSVDKFFIKVPYLDIHRSYEKLFYTAVLSW